MVIPDTVLIIFLPVKTNKQPTYSCPNRISRHTRLTYPLAITVPQQTTSHAHRYLTPCPNMTYLRLKNPAHPKTPLPLALHGQSPRTILPPMRKMLPPPPSYVLVARPSVARPFPRLRSGQAWPWSHGLQARATGNPCCARCVLGITVASSRDRSSDINKPSLVSTISRCGNNIFVIPAKAGIQLLEHRLLLSQR